MYEGMLVCGVRDYMGGGIRGTDQRRRILVATLRQKRTSKKGLCNRVGKDQSRPPARHADRGMVPGRGPDRPEEQDYRWARRGTRPSAPKDQRTKSAYIFGAICPELGKGAGLVQPFCNNQTMSLAEISLAIEPGAHGVLLMDQAGWHMTGKLEVSENIGIVPCRQNALNSTRSKISGSSCAITGCPTGSSPPTATLSTFAARPGTGWSINPGAS